MVFYLKTSLLLYKQHFYMQGKVCLFKGVLVPELCYKV